MIKFVKRIYKKQETIRAKLLITLIPTIVGSFFVFMLISYLASYQIMIEYTYNQADINLKQHSLLIDTYLAQIHQETDNLIFNEDFQEKILIDSTILTPQEKDAINLDLLTYMYDLIINNDKNVLAICVKSLDGEYHLWRMDGRVTSDDFYDRINHIEPTTDSYVGDIVLTYEKLNENVVTISRAILDPLTDEKLGTILVDFSISFLDQNINTSDEQDLTYLIVRDGDTVIFNNSPIPEQNINSIAPVDNYFDIGSNKYRVITHNSGYGLWDIMGITNENTLYQSATEAFRTQLLFFTIIFIVILITIIIISNSISRQFKHFIHKINQTNNIGEDVLIHVDSNDEFKELSLVYNEMLLRINNLINTIHSNEMALKNNELALSNAELKTLQAQINPHFLYNTLDCIYSLIELNRKEDTQKTVTALGSIMRISIKGKEITTVKGTIELIEQYMFIQKMRYQDRLIFLNEVPSSMYGYQMPKLIIQPLLENSIVHGIADLKRTGMVALTGHEEDDCLIFEIKDNGEGIPENICEVVNNTLDKSKITEDYKQSIGLINVQSRLKLLYGDDYGMIILKSEKSGTHIKIRIPKMLGDENE